jgi:hypothetical protein
MTPEMVTEGLGLWVRMMAAGVIVWVGVVVACLVTGVWRRRRRDRMSSVPSSVLKSIARKESRREFEGVSFTGPFKRDY